MINTTWGKRKEQKFLVFFGQSAPESLTFGGQHSFLYLQKMTLEKQLISLGGGVMESSEKTRKTGSEKQDPRKE